MGAHQEAEPRSQRSSDLTQRELEIATMDFEELSYAEAPRVMGTVPGPKSRKALETQRKFESNVVSYPRAIPIAFEEGKGATIKDMDGNVYVDFFSGAGVLNVGHCNPEVLRAVHEQEQKLIHALDFPTRPRLDLIQKLVSIAPGEMRNNSRVFFGGPTGSDAVEAAMKLAKFDTKRSGVIAFEGGYHGMTSGALSLSSGKKFKRDFIPLLPEVHFLPYAYCYRCPFGKKDALPGDGCRQCADNVRRVLDDPHSGVVTPAAMLVESVQGEGGSIVPPTDFVSDLREISTDYGIVLVDDEIQAGMGRTGKMFACEHSGTTPDITTISKGLGGIGFPLSAGMCLEKFDRWPPGSHIGTFRGQAVAMAAGHAALNFIEKYRVLEHATAIGEHMLKRLNALKDSSRIIGDVRGRGLMLGIEFVKDVTTKEPGQEIAQEVRKRCYQKGLIVEVGGHYDNVVRFLPPLIITQDLADRGLDVFSEAVKEQELAHG